MTIVLDTSVLAAYLHTGDSRHVAASDLMAQVLAGEMGVPVSSDHVLDEGMTLLRKRPGRQGVSQKFAALFFGDEDLRPVVDLRPADRHQLRRALELHLAHYARGLSFTDCVLAVTAQDLGCAVASFDAGFDGIVPRVSAAP